jgi:NAD(P)-dependent dehydrogenase (short-subunit alcohol dehydrogenase family)
MPSEPEQRSIENAAPELPDVNWVSGLRILVTGAAGAMGRGVVEEAVRQGASVAATGREPSLGAAELPAAAVRIVADLADPDECSALPGRAAEALGGLDVLINNAAVLVRRAFAELTLDNLEQTWRVNLRAPVLLMQAARPYLEQSRAPAIINVISGAAFNGGVDRVAPYAMSKAGLVTVTKSVAKEYGPLGIRVLALSPPSMESQMRTLLSPEVDARVRTFALLGRTAEMREVALTTLFAASPYASFMTGSVVDVTGSIV